jgi:hypothetical protein
MEDTMDTGSVKRVDNLAPEPADTNSYASYDQCVDCDDPAYLIHSQWGEEKEGDFICVPCESIREHHYGLPPVE